MCHRQPRRLSAAGVCCSAVLSPATNATSPERFRQQSYSGLLPVSASQCADTVTLECEEFDLQATWDPCESDYATLGRSAVRSQGWIYQVPNLCGDPRRPSLRAARPAETVDHFYLAALRRSGCSICRQPHMNLRRNGCQGRAMRLRSLCPRDRCHPDGGAHPLDRAGILSRPSAGSAAHQKRDSRSRALSRQDARAGPDLVCAAQQDPASFADVPEYLDQVALRHPATDIDPPGPAIRHGDHEDPLGGCLDGRRGNKQGVVCAPVSAWRSVITPANTACTLRYFSIPSMDRAAAS